MHALKDEISNWDEKSNYFIFISYVEDEFGYELYDSISKKVIKSCDAMFMESQTTEEIDKVEKNTTLEKDNILFDVDPTCLSDANSYTITDNVQNGEPHL